MRAFAFKKIEGGPLGNGFLGKATGQRKNV
jgi:hypothetical protein